MQEIGMHATPFEFRNPVLVCWSCPDKWSSFVPNLIDGLILTHLCLWSCMWHTYPTRVQPENIFVATAGRNCSRELVNCPSALDSQSSSPLQSHINSKPEIIVSQTYSTCSNMFVRMLGLAIAVAAGHPHHHNHGYSRSQKMFSNIWWGK